MQNKTNKINKILIGTVLTSSAVMFACGVNAIKPNLRVYADSTPTTVSIDNSSFRSGLSNWNALTSETSTVIAKAVDTENFEDYKEDYKLSTNPGKVASSTDNKVFMINSPTMPVSYGYKSNQFSLNANGYYIISVPVKTQNGGSASVYLTDGEDFKLKCENITSTSTYNTYSFYVKATKTLNVNLHLYLGNESGTSSGAVFFDEITAKSYTESTFYTLFNSRNLERSVTNFNASDVSEYEWKLSDNSNLTKLSEDGYNASAENFVQQIYAIDNSTTFPEKVKNPTNGNLVNNNYALLLNNPTEASVGVRYKNALPISQYDYVLLSTYVKTNLTTGGLTIKLSTYDEKEDEYVALSDSIANFTTSTDSSSKLEGWEKVCIAIKASAFEEKDVYVEFWLGNGEKTAKGYAFVGKLCFEEITSTQYEEFSTSSSLVKAKLDNLTEDSKSFKNHSFNDFAKSEKYNSYTHAFVEPSYLTKQDEHIVNYGSWNGLDTFASGIINTNETVFNSVNYPFSNPGLTPIQAHSNLSTQTNNVFAIYQKANAVQEYKTADITLDANSYYKLTIYVKTQVSNGGARWAIYNDDVLITEFKDVISNEYWTTLTAYIKTGAKSYDNINAVLGLGRTDNKAYGVAFFDDMMVETCEESDFNSATASNKTSVVDLKTDSFNLISGNKLNDLYESDNWKTNQNSENFAGGVLDTTNVNTTTNNPDSPNGNKNVLVINNKEDLISSYDNKFTYKLTANSYYKISVWVKTYELNQSALNVNYSDDKNENAIPYGATIYLDNITEKFEGIQDTEWTEYVFFVNSSDDIEMTMHLGLGYEKAKTSGYAYFADITVESLEEDAYTVQTATYDEEKLPATVKMVKNAKSEEENTEENQKTDSMGELNYLLIPTLITALAILIAIIGTILRQINFNKFVKLKKKTNSYDRRKIKTKTIRNAEIQNIVNEKLSELNNKLASLESEQEKLEKEVLSYKDEFNSYKGKKQLTKEEKHSKKVAKQNYYNSYNNLIVVMQDISTLKDDIKKIKSDKYVLKEEYNLMKKTWREEKQAEKLEKRNQKAKKNNN